MWYLCTGSTDRYLDREFRYPTAIVSGRARATTQGLVQVKRTFYCMCISFYGSYFIFIHKKHLGVTQGE